ncbi:MAG: hypothetical protein ABIH08_06545, partial [Candidatus Omnitrophota bacterium]
MRKLLLVAAGLSIVICCAQFQKIWAQEPETISPKTANVDDAKIVDKTKMLEEIEKAKEALKITEKVENANLQEAKTLDIFCIYSDKNSPKNHFVPSGWMGDYGDLKFNDQSTKEFFSGATAIELTYTAQKSQNKGWAGVYWQSAQNNWGSKDSGFDLSGFNKLVFMAKGKKGGEVITKVKVGGIIKNVITDEPLIFADSLDIEYGPIRLTTDWRQYYINLVEKDLSYINGGFALIFNTDQSEGEQTIYLDDIAYIYDSELRKEDDRVNLPFYVYADNGSLDNHFIPSGWMPATAAKDLRLNTSYKNKPFSGDSCMRVEYKNDSGTRWAGIYWQQP